MKYIGAKGHQSTPKQKKMGVYTHTTQMYKMLTFGESR